MSLALNATGRPILYACSWPAYYQGSGLFNQTEWNLLSEYCNYWRNYNDINDDWDSVSDIIEWWGNNQNTIAPIAGPGHWNDPDMVLCGDFALSLYECRTQFALWSLWSAPLYLSVDLRQLDPAVKVVLQNKEVIAIDQDRLGKQGTRVATFGCDDSGIHCAQSVWRKQLSNGDIAVVLYNRENYGMPQTITATWQQLSLQPNAVYKVRDLWQGKDLGTFSSSFNASVNTHDALIFRFIASSNTEAVNPVEAAQVTKAWRHGAVMPN